MGILSCSRTLGKSSDLARSFMGFTFWLLPMGIQLYSTAKNIQFFSQAILICQLLNQYGYLFMLCVERSKEGSVSCPRTLGKSSDPAGS
jgi:hypothetical protein